MKYRITDEYIEVFGVRLHRIEALISFSNIKKGELGGYIERENNLSQCGDAWVYDNAKVCGNAKVYGNAWVCGNAKVYGDAEVCGNAKVYGDAEVCDNAKVYGNAWVCDNAKVYGNAEVFGNAEVCGDAEVYGAADYIVFKNWWSSGRYFTFTFSNKKWRVGCFYGDSEELVKKAIGDSEESGREYKRVVDYVNSIINEKGGAR